MKAWIAISRDGKPRPWTLSYRRADTMQSATETMMGARDYELLSNLRARWKRCYRRGCRIVPVTVTIPEDQAND